MDKVKQAVSAFNKYASQYQDKYMRYAPYSATYDGFAALFTESHSTVLDVGCGPGNFSRYLLENIPSLRITGTDLAPKMIELARQNIPQGEFHILDTREIGSLNRSFDVILLGFCLPYLSKEASTRLLGELGSMTRTGGLLYLSTMEGNYADSGYQSNDSEDRIFTYYHDKEFLTDLLEINNFETIHIERIPYPTEGGLEIDDLFIYARFRD